MHNFVIHREQKLVLIYAKEPEKVLSAIPAAKQLDYHGTPLVVVHYKLREAQALWRLGYKVPSPMGYYYDWPHSRLLIPDGPYAHQKETAGFATLCPRGYILNQIGTGKTLAALWAADYAMREGLIRKALIISPLSTLERVWDDSIFMHLTHRSATVLHGSAKKRRSLFSNDHYDFYIINHDALDIISDITWKETKVRQNPNDPFETPVIVKKADKVKLLRDDIDLIIVDELAVYRNSQNNRWRILHKIVKPETWVWGMTGTPTPNEPSDAWAQCRIVTPWTVPSNFSAFRQTTMQQLTEYIWVPRKEAPEVVAKVMQPSIMFVRDECIDLPEATYSTRSAPLSNEQEKHYKEIATKLITEINGGKVTAVNEGVKAGKLIQIACGVVYDSQGGEQVINSAPRVKLVEELIEEAGHKVIIFVPFRAPLEMLYTKLSAKHKCAMVHGGVSASVRGKIFSEFQLKASGLRVLIADAGCMSHGLTLTEANTIIWYGPEWSNDTYTQANGRITRPGQKNHQHIIHISSTEIERRIYTRLATRQKVQGTVLELVKAGGSLI